MVNDLRFTKKEATTRARALLLLMKTSGWKIRVWKNMGWNYALQHENGLINIYPSCLGTYYAFVSDIPFLAGEPAIWAAAEHTTSKDPNVAVTLAVRRMLVYMQRVGAIAEQVQEFQKCRPAKRKQG